MNSSDDVNVILVPILNGLDEDIINYVISAVESMSDVEKKDINLLNEMISPFLIDSGYSNEAESMEICKKIAMKFGWSGYTSKLATSSNMALQDENIPLLSAPIRMIETTVAPSKIKKDSYINAFNINLSEDDYVDTKYDTSAHIPQLNHNPSTNYDVKQIPTTAKDLRKQRKETEKLQKAIQLEG